MSSIPIVRTPADLRERLSQARSNGARVALAPTMGALHRGHLSLIELARAHAAVVVASVFVNPTQFGPQEDFASYPRDEAGDVAHLARAGCDLVYAPTPAAMYPPGFSTKVEVAGVSAPLEGSFRPHHFAGVATVVAKLLIQAAPDVAVFGEKDFQQLQVIRRLALDLDLPVEILGAQIVRDPDGLALSSRNAYLNPDERRVAPALNRALRLAAADLVSGAKVEDVESRSRAMIEEAGFDQVDYLEVRRPDDLSRLGPGPIEGPARILTAARIGRTRLIDNIAV
jgi:pantoate--beta-alanine ligase